MKLWSMTLAALFALTLITGCGQKEEAAPVDDAAMESTMDEAPAADDAPAAPAAPASAEPGGYEPTPEERVPPAEEAVEDIK